MKRSNKLFVEDILDSIDKIEQYIQGLSYDDFVEKQIVVDAVIRNLEIIGEASKNMPDDIKKKYISIPWKRMVGLRNIIAHGYFGIDLSIVWEIITKNLPETKPHIVEFFNKLDWMSLFYDIDIAIGFFNGPMGIRTPVTGSEGR